MTGSAAPCHQTLQETACHKPPKLTNLVGRPSLNLRGRTLHKQPKVRGKGQSHGKSFFQMPILASGAQDGLISMTWPHWCLYNRPYWNWGGTDDHTTLQNKILYVIYEFLKKVSGGPRPTCLVRVHCAM